MSNFKFKRGFKSWCENTAIILRDELRLHKTAPLPSKLLAKHMDIDVVEFSTLMIPTESSSYLLNEGQSEWSAVTVSNKGKTAILINYAHNNGRQNNSLMHELSHLILKHEPSKFSTLMEAGISLRTFDNEIEREADWLAATILLPRPVLELIAKQNKLEKATEEYNVSIELLRFRLNLTGIGKQYQLFN